MIFEYYPLIATSLPSGDYRDSTVRSTKVLLD
jgi:hypothetical protein